MNSWGRGDTKDGRRLGEKEAKWSSILRVDTAQTVDKAVVMTCTPQRCLEGGPGPGLLHEATQHRRPRQALEICSL
eukprot:Skav213830  [mRNA]  locus=scaffold1987:763622:763849:+ [translate_table: standard]